MSFNPETITQLQTLLQADPALLAQLQAETELAGVAAVIAHAASAQGLDLSEADLMSHLAAEQSQASAVAMSDAELEQVAGGGFIGDALRNTTGFGRFLSAVTAFDCSKKNGRFFEGGVLFDPLRIER